MNVRSAQLPLDLAGKAYLLDLGLFGNKRAVDVVLDLEFALKRAVYVDSYRCASYRGSIFTCNI